MRQSVSSLKSGISCKDKLDEINAKLSIITKEIGGIKDAKQKRELLLLQKLNISIYQNNSEPSSMLRDSTQVNNLRTSLCKGLLSSKNL